MRALTLYEGEAIVSSTETNETPVDMTSQDLPFAPGNTAVAVFNLRAAAAATINLQKSDLGSGDTDWTTVASETVMSAETRSVFFDQVQIGQRMRLQTVGATSGAGAVDVVLLGN